MIEKCGYIDIMSQVIEGLLTTVACVPGVQAIAFYGHPPTDGNDLDLLIVSDDQARDNLNDKLQIISDQFNLTIDAWILSLDVLKKRMKRIAGMKSDNPPILSDVSTWTNFAFLPILNKGLVTDTIRECYEHPETGGPIPPSDNEKRVFVPSN